MIYLASPYTPTRDGDSMQERAEAVAKAAAKLMQDGHVVFSPIVHSHHIAAYLPDDKRCDFDFWMAQDIQFLANATKLVVLTLDGWAASRGVRYEMREAHARQIPVEFMEPV